MDDPFTQYINQPNLTEAIAEVNVVQAKAKQTGNPYTCLELVFINGFKTRLFPNGGDKFAIAQAFGKVLE